MTTALNLTLKLKQDADSKKALDALKSSFATVIQPMIDKALRESQLVHFARVLVIDDQYIQVITEFDGDKKVYTEWFRKSLPNVFAAIFSLAEGAPSWAELNDPDKFYSYSSRMNVRSLGADPNNPIAEGFLFSATGDHTVKEIVGKLA